MPTIEYDEKIYAEDQMFEDDKRLFVTFFMEAVQDKVASAREGRPIFVEKPNIRIITPGSRDVTVVRAHEGYQKRFPRQWERFIKQQEQSVDGTPLEQVPWLTVGVIAELKAVNCCTLEQLAGMSDTHMTKMMGLIGFKQKAVAYLAAAKEAAPFTQMQAQLEQRDVEISLLKQQVQELVELAAKKKE